MNPNEFCCEYDYLTAVTREGIKPGVETKVVYAASLLPEQPHKSQSPDGAPPFPTKGSRKMRPAPTAFTVPKNSVPWPVSPS